MSPTRLAKITLSFTALLAASPALAASGTGASAYSVYAGCTAPTGIYAHTYYVDPVNGADDGDGSKTKPWKTLQTVISSGKIATQSYKGGYVDGAALLPAAPTGIVKPGDQILLLSGNHGTITLLNAYNANFIAIKAAPGATPVINSLSVSAAGYWIFDGLTIKAINTSATPLSLTLASFGAHAFYGPLNNIIINGNTLKSQDDTTAWLPEDWRNKGSSGIYLNSGRRLAGGAIDYNGVNDGQCFAITNNKISNILFGLNATQSDKVLIAKNTIDHFADDAIDYGSSDLLISQNTITNSIDDGDAYHRDAMQGQPYWGETTYNHDVVITGNTVIAQTSAAATKYPGCLQGIDSFDGLWTNVTVTNNLVITTAYHGISYYGITNGKIINNTVLGSEYGGSCFKQPGSAVGNEAQSAGPNSDAVDAGGAAWIGVFNAKSGSPSDNVIVTNNIASTYSVNTAGVTFNHNVVAGTNTKIWLPLPTGGVAPIFADPTTIFVKFDPVTYNYNLHLAPGSAAIGAGAAFDAPTTDIYGTPRKAPIDAGAISYVSVNNTPGIAVPTATVGQTSAATPASNTSPATPLAVNVHTAK